MLLNESTRLLLLLLGTIAITALPSKTLNIPRPFSRKAALIHEAVTNQDLVSADNSGVPLDSIAAYGTFIDDGIGYGSAPVHCEHVYYPAILSAQEEVVLTTFLFDSASPCGAVAAKALRDLNSKVEKSKGGKVRAYFLVSTLSKFMFWKNPQSKIPGFSDFIHHLSEAKPEVFGLPAASEIPNIDLRVKTFHRWPLGTIHNKLLVVDGQELAIGSKNWDQLAGYEYAARWQGSIAQSARKDFERIWEEPLPNLTTVATAKMVMKDGAVPMLYVSRTSNPWFTHPEDNPMDQAWIKALELAEREVYIQTPNFTTETVVQKVLEAVRRGVKVKIVTAFSFHDVASYFNTKAVGNNRYTIKQMYDDLDGEAQQVIDNLQVCYFIGKRVQPPRPVAEEFAHVKFMAVDGEFYIFGSGNQDTQSWYNSSETNVLVDDAEDTERVLKRLLTDQQSFEHCYRGLSGERDITDPAWREEQSTPAPTPNDPFWSGNAKKSKAPKNK